MNLDHLINEIKKDLKNDVKYYQTNIISDVTNNFYVSEIIREKILRNFNHEIPHKIYVEVDKSQNKKNVYYFLVNIMISRKNYKAILIGANGSSLKEIGRLSRIELEKYFEKKVFLDINIKIEENWENKDEVLKKITNI